MTEESYAYYLRHGIIRVARLDGEVAGFLIAYAVDSEQFGHLLPYLSVVEWSDPTVPRMKKLYYVDRKATAPRFQRRGVARALYGAVLAEFPQWCFFGATFEKPILNGASQAARVGLGFKRVGTFKAQEFCGLRGYQSGLYLLRGTATGLAGRQD